MKLRTHYRMIVFTVVMIIIAISSCQKEDEIDIQNVKFPEKFRTGSKGNDEARKKAGKSIFSREHEEGT